MKILVINYEYPPLGGGAGTVSHDLAKGLVRLGHAVDVVTMCFKGLPKHEELDGIRIHRVASLRSRKEASNFIEMLSFICSASLFLSKHLKNHHYDICHCHFIIPTGILAYFLKYKFGLPYIITPHGSDVPGYNTDRFKKMHRFTRPLLHSICGNSLKIVCPSRYLEKLIQKNIGDVPTTYIPNGLDLERFNVPEKLNKEKVILSTGRLLPRKGFQTLIRAVHEVKLPWEVHIVGDGPYRNELQDLAKDSKTKIVFHGWLDKESEQLAQLYEKASIYVLVSQKENASISLLEGMAFQCTVITSDVSGCPETIGDAGLKIGFDDATSLRQHFISLAADSQRIEEFGRKAKLRLHDKFDLPRIVLQYQELMETVVQ